MLKMKLDLEEKTKSVALLQKALVRIDFKLCDDIFLFMRFLLCIYSFHMTPLFRLTHIMRQTLNRIVVSVNSLLLKG